MKEAEPEKKIEIPTTPTRISPRSEHPPAPLPRGGGECILVVDDESHVRSVTEQILSRQGYRVISVSNGKEALQAMAKRPGEVTAVLTDIMMPLMDGMALVTRLKQTHPGLPIIACTGWGQEGMQLKLEALGVKSFLQKPYPSETLLVALNQHLTGTAS